MYIILYVQIFEQNFMFAEITKSEHKKEGNEALFSQKTD